jgi:HEAT repeats
MIRMAGPGMKLINAPLSVFALPMLQDLPFHDRLLFLLVIGICVLTCFVFLFTATALLLRIKNIRTASKWTKLEDSWEPPLMEVLYGEGPPEALWKVVGPEVELHFVNYLLRFMRRLSGEERDRIRAVAAPYLPRILKRLQRRGPERRARAIQTLGELGLREHADRIVEMLDDPSPLVAMTAARALAAKEHPQYTEAIIARLHRFSNWRPSFLSAVLAAIGPGAVPALHRAFGDPQARSSVRAIAANALGQLNDFSSAEIAIAVLRDSAERDLTASTLRLLGRVGRAEDVPIVRSMLSSQDDVIRGAAAGALGRLGSVSDVELLERATRDDPSQWVAITAARGLRELGGVKALRDLAASAHTRAPLALQILAEVA